MELMGYEKEICLSAIDKYGPAVQQSQTEEELAELIVALKHYHRGRVKFKAVLEEIADVYIMLTQIRQIYSVGDDQMSEAIAKKIGKLKDRLEME